jgi:putative transposase
VYLAITEASKKCFMPIHNRQQAMVRFIIEFGDRLEKHLK